MTYNNLVKCTYVNKYETIFLPTWSLQNLETLSEYVFLFQYIYLLSSVRICSPCNRTQLETLIKLMKRKYMCPKMADWASREVPVPAPGLFQVLLPAPLPTHAKSAKYAEVEVYTHFVLGAQTLGDHSPLSPPALNKPILQDLQVPLGFSVGRSSPGSVTLPLL